MRRQIDYNTLSKYSISLTNTKKKLFSSQSFATIFPYASLLVPFKKRKVLHNILKYIIGNYNTSARITAQLLTPLMLCAFVLYMSGTVYFFFLLSSFKYVFQYFLSKLLLCVVIIVMCVAIRKLLAPYGRKQVQLQNVC